VLPLLESLQVTAGKLKEITASLHEAVNGLKQRCKVIEHWMFGSWFLQRPLWVLQAEQQMHEEWVGFCSRTDCTYESTDVSQAPTFAFNPQSPTFVPRRPSVIEFAELLPDSGAQVEQAPTDPNGKAREENEALQVLVEEMACSNEPNTESLNLAQWLLAAMWPTTQLPTLLQFMALGRCSSIKLLQLLAIFWGKLLVMLSARWYPVHMRRLLQL